MTTRLHGFTVVFEKDIREDDAEELKKAISLLKGVIRVEPIEADIATHIARVRTHYDLANRLWEVLKDAKDKL